MFSYNPDTGVVTHVETGSQGYINQGYCCFTIDGSKYLAHRLALELSGVDISDCQVDHINGDGLDNRRSNLRVATHSQNKMNTPRQKNNTSGFKRVVKSGSGYRADIQADGRQKYLGTFKTKEAAHLAYQEAAQKFHKEFANHG